MDRAIDDRMSRINDAEAEGDTDGKKADGFRSMVVAQFTAVSLQKDDNAFIKWK